MIRFTNHYNTCRHFTQAEDNRMLRKKFGADFMGVEEISRRTSLMFVNQHYSLTGSKPLSPQLIEIGGIHIQEDNDKLETKEFGVLRNFLDLAIDGAVIVSWGSVMNDSSRPEHIVESMKSVMKRSPLQFVLKGDSQSDFEELSNVLVVKWLPQKEVLCKSFVCHKSQ